MSKIKFTIIFISLFVSSLAFSQQTNNNNESLSTNPDSSIYTVVPVMPQFGEAQEALQSFINKESKLKTSMTRTDRTKNLFVQIVVEKNGNVSFDKIARGVNKRMDKEAKRIVKNMPDWTAGKLEDGSFARVSIMFPIWFK